MFLFCFTPELCFNFCLILVSVFAIIFSDNSLKVPSNFKLGDYGKSLAWLVSLCESCVELASHDPLTVLLAMERRQHFALCDDDEYYFHVKMLVRSDQQPMCVSWPKLLPSLASQIPALPNYCQKSKTGKGVYCIYIINRKNIYCWRIFLQAVKNSIEKQARFSTRTEPTLSTVQSIVNRYFTGIFIIEYAFIYSVLPI